MNILNSKLYEYMIQHSTEITDAWLDQRQIQKGSIYSADAESEKVSLLRKQNRQTNYTVSFALLGDEASFQEEVLKWAEDVAESRVGSGTPIHEVLNAVSSVREIYWSFVTQFINHYKEELSFQDVVQWGNIIHSAFDALSIQFSKMYHEIMKKRLSSQQEVIEELGSPVIVFSEGKAVLPLVGDIDTSRAKNILDHVPTKCSEKNIDHLYIDLSGVSIIDTMVALQIQQMIQVLSLLGTDSTLTGIRPEIAQTAIQLGINLDSIKTFGTLQQAFTSSGIKIK
ncbi:STAS domain-containing protein [Metabacillus sp. GX 13764]|uniref:STAS domain-containing protein n=1 Tax=Metabacillus kandeliae TaxID=2900151 RepID=UPI001E460CB1|nr:STAS domain-containing protein [Metabacillus kandeliae]MCD7035018.1 STAS domain-containing protein [Metabacillus kandeliae]